MNDHSPFSLEAPEGSTSRRLFLQKVAQFGTAGLATVLLAACGGGESGEGGESAAASSGCTVDESSLAEEVQQSRQSVQYVAETPNPEQRCDNCNLYEQPEGDAACGGCQVVQGPIHPEGWCSLWVAMQPS